MSDETLSIADYERVINHQQATIARLERELGEARATLEDVRQWAPVPDDVPLNSFGDYMHNRTLFVRCTVAGNGSILHGYTLSDGEYLVRRHATDAGGERAEV